MKFSLHDAKMNHFGNFLRCQSSKIMKHLNHKITLTFFNKNESFVSVKLDASFGKMYQLKFLHIFSHLFKPL